MPLPYLTDFCITAILLLSMALVIEQNNEVNM